MFRPTQPEDTPGLLAITEGTGLFLPIDLEALDSVLQAYHEENALQGHRCITCEQEGKLAGFAYYAPAAMTDRTWYLWWIVVSKQIQARGLGSQMLRHVEDAVRSQSGRLLIVETSSLPSYELTRRFYFKHGYENNAILKDYYADAHDMIIFCKRITPASAAPASATLADRS